MSYCVLQRYGIQTTCVRFDRDPNEPRVHKTDYGTVKEKTRYRGLNWETYETGSQQYLSIGKFSSPCMRPTGKTKGADSFRKFLLHCT